MESVEVAARVTTFQSEVEKGVGISGDELPDAAAGGMSTLEATEVSIVDCM